MIIVLFVFFIATTTTTTTTNHHTILIGCLHCRQSSLPTARSSLLRRCCSLAVLHRWRLSFGGSLAVLHGGCPVLHLSAAAGSLSAVAVVCGHVGGCRSLSAVVVGGCAVVGGCSSSSAAAVLHRRLSAVLDRR